MRTYSDPALQALVEDMRANVAAADKIIASMRKTMQIGKRRDDKSTPLTAEQSARIEANRGKHIYGNSHPKYKES